MGLAHPRTPRYAVRVSSTATIRKPPRPPHGARARAWRFPSSAEEIRWRDNLRRRMIRAGLSWTYADTLAGRALTLRRIVLASDEVYARDTAEWWRCRQEFVDAERELVEIEAKAGTRPLTRTEPTAAATTPEVAPPAPPTAASPSVADLFESSAD